ncbi:MAG: hypothetical protein PHW69_09885 [Elusimicrobiaceae bacterium]|nr:hypothetical protein [Elusimicrobiaceae bacterium]
MARTAKTIITAALLGFAVRAGWALDLIPVSSTETVAPASADGGSVFSGRDPFMPVPAAPKAEEKKSFSAAIPKNYQPELARLVFRGKAEILSAAQAQLYDPVSGRSYFATGGKLYDSRLKPLDGVTAEIGETAVTFTKGGRKVVLTLGKKK